MPSRISYCNAFCFYSHSVITRSFDQAFWNYVRLLVLGKLHKSTSHTRLTIRLRPTSDRKMLESGANRRKNVRLVAEVVGDRQGKISRSKVMVMFKTPKAPVTPGLRPGYDLPATEKNVGFVGKSLKERTTGGRGRG